MKNILKWFRSLRQKPITPITVTPLPPETNIEWEHEEVEFQRLPELPISKGRKMKPQAIVIHYTAGWRNQRAYDAISFMQRVGHGYLFIDKWGSVWQHINLDESYAHAGLSMMPNFSNLAGRTSVSNFSIGIEVACGGRVDDKNKTSFGKVVAEDQIRSSNFAVHGKYGRYEIFTPEQEKALIDSIVILCKKFNIHPSNIVGHHEISPTRRDDPAASLSMGTHKLRAIVADELLK
jgi:N-acetyl-anhydromuramyl-L-alanine amidase AmpD